MNVENSSKIRILSVSDYSVPRLIERINDRDIEPVDLVLACGDLPPEYLAGLAQAAGVPLYYVMGNHDIRIDAYPPKGCTDLHARVMQFGGLRLLGMAGSHWYNGGPNQFTEAEMKKLVRTARSAVRRAGGLDIVITHAPPLGIRDGEDLCHRGFESFCKLIEQYRPAYFIHGHIHQQFEDDSDRITELAHTKVINTYGYIILEVEPEKISKPVRKFWKSLRRSGSGSQKH